MKCCLSVYHTYDCGTYEIGESRIQAPGGGRLQAAKGAKTNGMWSRVQDKNSTSFTQECTVRLFLAVARSAGAAATSGVGLPGPAANH